MSFISLVFPPSGIKIASHLSLKFPSLAQVINKKILVDTTIEPALDVNQLLENYTVEIDSLMLLDTADTTKIKEIKKQQNKVKIQYPESNINALNNFFMALEQVKRYPVRILHYGDSQIEGDRMTGYLRNEFQKQFGGTGCGLLPIYERFPTFAIRQSASGNWQRFAAYYSKSKKNKRYGLMACYYRFNKAIADSLLDKAIIAKAWTRFVPNKKTYQRSGKFNKIRLLYGFNRREVIAKVWVNDQLSITDTLPISNQSTSVIWSLSEYPSSVKIEFEGVDSPDIYGISLESSQGIHVDNIGMRGSSGTFFTQIDQQTLKQQFADLDPNFLLLQYGGNTVPSIHSKKQAREYGNWFESQIRLLKRLNPSASILVIGPSDMSAEVNGKLQTRKYLEDVRDALKQAAFNSGCAFWDLYEAMGGKNSMISWVAAQPPLAANDYTHFAPGGAKRLTRLFYKSLMEDYKLWKKGQNKKAS